MQGAEALLEKPHQKNKKHTAFGRGNVDGERREVPQSASVSRDRHPREASRVHIESKGTGGDGGYCIDPYLAASVSVRSALPGVEQAF